MFMLSCCQFYLKNGLIKYESNDLKIKKIIQECGEEFYEFFERIEKNKEYNKKQLFEKFIKENPTESHRKQNTFSKKLKIYCKINNFTYKERISSGKYYSIIEVQK